MKQLLVNTALLKAQINQIITTIVSSFNTSSTSRERKKSVKTNRNGVEQSDFKPKLQHFTRFIPSSNARNSWFTGSFKTPFAKKKEKKESLKKR